MSYLPEVFVGTQLETEAQVKNGKVMMKRGNSGQRESAGQGTRNASR
jgi:hypothetical protein